jgi:curved DNA-binding protein CbpA
MVKDYYRTLGVPRDADEKMIRSAHRALARRYHPDTGKGASEERFRAIQHAYDILSDPAQRRAYDRTLEPPAEVAFAPPASRDAYCRPASSPDHIDLRHLATHRAAAEPLQSRSRTGGRPRTLEEEMLRDLIEFMRFFDRF